MNQVNITPRRPTELSVKQRRNVVNIAPIVRVLKIAPNVHRIGIEQRPQPIVNIRARGLRGAPGGPGPAGGSIAPIEFSFGDASGVIWTATDAGTLTTARISMDEAFDDPTATVSLGIPSDHDAVLPTAYVAPSMVSEYEHTADLHLAPGDSVRIYPNPGTSTQGGGRIFLTFLPD